MGIKVPTVVDALFPGGKPLPAWGTGGDTVAALAVDLPSEAAEGCGVSLVFSISSSVSIGGGSGGVLLFNALWERGGYHPVWCHFHEFLRNRSEVLLALCLLPNLKICEQTESEQRGKNRKNRVTAAATPSNLKGRPKTKANT